MHMQSRGWLTTAVAVAGLAFTATACEPEDQVGPAPVAAQSVTYVADDFSFEGPDTLPAGWTTIRLRNEGQEIHHLSLMKLDEGTTLADVQAHVASGIEAAPDWVTEIGGPNASIGPFEAVATVYLEEGNYVAVCIIPSPDGVLHLAKGMFKALTVSGDGGDSPPVADITVDMMDFAFAQDKPYTAGNHTIKVTNSGQQPHEIVLVKLDEGKTAADFAAAFAPDAPPGPPPGMPVGGVTPLSRGQTAYFQAELTPGNYAALCFLPDPETGRVHIDLGMMQEFTVEG
jgi:hypothetical protein